MNVRLRYSTVFTAGIFYDGLMRMNNYQVKLHLVTNSESSHDHNIALDRIKYFLHNQINSTIFINSNNVDQCKLLAVAGLNITTLPEEPVDQIIGIMLYCKLNSILEDVLLVDEIEICSELGENIVYLHNDQETLGPFNDSGWWQDSDPAHCDLNMFDTEKILALNHLTSNWRELGLHWDDDFVLPADIDNKVVFADFARDETR